MLRRHMPHAATWSRCHDMHYVTPPFRCHLFRRAMMPLIALISCRACSPAAADCCRLRRSLFFDAASITPPFRSLDSRAPPYRHTITPLPDAMLLDPWSLIPPADVAVDAYAAVAPLRLSPPPPPRHHTIRYAFDACAAYFLRVA